VNIAYLPQVSMRSYVDNRWLLSASSQLVRMAAYTREAPESWRWHWILPHHLQLDSGWSDVLTGSQNVEPYHVPWGNDVRIGRFYLPWPELEKMRDVRGPFDLVLTEVPEHAMALEYLFQCPVVSFNVHVEPGHFPPTLLRQVEGLERSRCTAFQSERERNIWFEHAEPWESKRSRTAVWPGMYSWRTTQESVVPPYVLDEPQIPVVFFISRLSDGGRTKPDVFGKAIDTMKMGGVQCAVWYANPNEAMPWDEVRKLPGYVRHPFGDKTLTRGQYFGLLHASHVVPILYPNQSGGLCEAVELDNALVTVRENELGVRCDPIDPDDVAASLVDAIGAHRDPDFLENQREICRSKFSVERNSDVFLETLSSAAVTA
jgi:hypothetical protein